MKRDYISPQLSDIVVETDLFLAASGEITRNEDNSQATVTPSEGEYSGSDWRSRRHEQWEDEELEEY